MNDPDKLWRSGRVAYPVETFGRWREREVFDNSHAMGWSDEANRRNDHLPVKRCNFWEMSPLVE